MQPVLGILLRVITHLVRNPLVKVVILFPIFFSLLTILNFFFLNYKIWWWCREMTMWRDHNFHHPPCWSFWKVLWGGIKNKSINIYHSHSCPTEMIANLYVNEINITWSNMGGTSPPQRVEINHIASRDIIQWCKEQEWGYLTSCWQPQCRGSIPETWNWTSCRRSVQTALISWPVGTHPAIYPPLKTLEARRWEPSRLGFNFLHFFPNSQKINSQDHQIFLVLGSWHVKVKSREFFIPIFHIGLGSHSKTLKCSNR